MAVPLKNIELWRKDVRDVTPAVALRIAINLVDARIDAIRAQARKSRAQKVECAELKLARIALLSALQA